MIVHIRKIYKAAYRGNSGFEVPPPLSVSKWKRTQAEHHIEQTQFHSFVATDALTSWCWRLGAPGTLPSSDITHRWICQVTKWMPHLQQLRLPIALDVFARQGKFIDYLPVMLYIGSLLVFHRLNWTWYLFELCSLTFVGIALTVPAYLPGFCMTYVLKPGVFTVLRYPLTANIWYLSSWVTLRMTCFIDRMLLTSSGE